MGSSKDFWASHASADEAATDSKDLAALAEDVAGVGYWQLEVATRAIRWSRGLFKLYGLPIGDEPDLESAMAVVHPDDTALAVSKLENAIATGTDYGSEVRLKRADGSWRTVKTQVVCQRNAEGAVTKLLGTCLDVTDVFVTGEALKRSEARYRLLVENATEIISESTPDGTITFITPACRTILGYQPEEMIGHRTLEFIHPADSPTLIAAFSKFFADGPGAAPLAVQFRGRHKDGHWIWLEGNPRPIFDETTGKPVAMQDGLRDITKRRLVEERLQRSEERYRLLAERSRDIIIRADLLGKILYISPSCSALGYHPQELVGQNGVSLVHPDDLENYLINSKALAADEPEETLRHREHRFQSKTGEWVWLQGNPTVIRDDNGKPHEILNVFRDVTERRKIDEALAEARQATEAAAAAKSEFLANMSHEIRTPLTSIIGFSQLLKEQPELSPRSAGFADRVVQASGSLLALVNDILDFSKLEAGHIEIKPEPVELRSLAAEVLELFAPQSKAKRIALRLDMQRAAPEMISVDGNRLRQILLNLVGNAVKFTDAGSVILVVHHSNGRLRCEVHDTGAGITSENAKLLFQRFSQVDGSSRRAQTGTGLGLAICKGLSEAMGGSIAVQSEVGVGSCFWIDIPAPAIALAAKSVLPLPEHADLTGARILVVDDNRANRALMQAMLQPTGVDLTLAETGREALSLATERPFDVILMDVHMPDLNGPTAALAIRTGKGPNTTTPILAFTADAVRGSEPGSLEGVFDGVVLKPVSIAALANAISTARRRHADRVARHA